MSEWLIEVADHPAVSANRSVVFQFDYLPASWAESNCFGVFSSLHIFCYMFRYSRLLVNT